MGATAYRVEFDEQFADTAVVRYRNAAGDYGCEERDASAAALQDEADGRNEHHQRRARDHVTVAHVEAVERLCLGGLVGGDYGRKLVHRDPVQEAPHDQTDRCDEESGGGDESCSIEVVARCVGHAG